MPFELPALPYNKSALVPYLSEETLDYHYGKHHRTYVMNLNSLIKNTVFDNRTLEEIVRGSTGAIFNNAAQAWNHTFYWNCLTPNAESEPTGELASAIKSNFGSFSVFTEKFTDAAIRNFGSGWTWLVKENNNKLSIISTSNSENPLNTEKKPLMTVDIWEHAYYIDYRNMRQKYLENFWKLINWKFVSKNFLE